MVISMICLVQLFDLISLLCYSCIKAILCYVLDRVCIFCWLPVQSKYPKKTRIPVFLVHDQEIKEIIFLLILTCNSIVYLMLMCLLTTHDRGRGYLVGYNNNIAWSFGTIIIFYLMATFTSVKASPLCPPPTSSSSCVSNKNY